MEEPKRQKPYAKPQGERRGLLLVYTGDGKGKSTAAFGLALRAHGRGLKVRIFQFIKHGTARFGEHRAFSLLGIPIEGLGDGFTWRSRDLARSAALAQEGWGGPRRPSSPGPTTWWSWTRPPTPALRLGFPGGVPGSLAGEASPRPRGGDGRGAPGGPLGVGRHGDGDAEGEARL